MTFQENTLVDDLTNDLVGALSFVMDEDTEMEFSEMKQTKKILSTAHYVMDGEFAAGEMYGKLHIPFTVKDKVATVNKIMIGFREDELVECAYPAQSKTFIDLLTNTYQLHLTRSKAAPVRNKKIISLCAEIKNANTIADASKLADEIVSVLETNYAN